MTAKPSWRGISMLMWGHWSSPFPLYFSKEHFAGCFLGVQGHFHLAQLSRSLPRAPLWLSSARALLRSRAPGQNSSPTGPLHSEVMTASHEQSVKTTLTDDPSPCRLLPLDLPAQWYQHPSGSQAQRLLPFPLTLFTLHDLSDHKHCLCLLP